jgi:hypothetical protein
MRVLYALFCGALSNIMQCIYTLAGLKVMANKVMIAFAQAEAYATSAE